MIDYKEIIENLRLEDVEKLLTELDIPFQDKGAYLVCKTACHNVDVEAASWKLYYYKDSHWFYCFTECGSLSIFNLLKQYYEIRDIPYDWYNDIYNRIVHCSDYHKEEGFTHEQYKPIRDNYLPILPKELPRYDEKVLNAFIKFYPSEWLDDHITIQAMDKYNIGYSISMNKIIIPHYDAGGRLIGIRGRALDPEDIALYGKYTPICFENKWYSHPLSMNLYGLNWNKENIKANKIAYIFESEKACMQAESFSTPNCGVAACGSNFNKYALKILMKECSPREVVICFDNEEVEGRKYFNKLYDLCSKYKNYCNFSFIYDERKLTKLKDSPTDNGEEIWNELLRKRVYVR